ncbi:benenodin family lasso peptide [Caulobacter segnis]
MERIDYTGDDLIDLGAASVETQGGAPVGMELDLGRDAPGLSAD